MVAQKGHDKAVDWWAIGVLMYEMLIGVTPFFNRNRNVLLKKITSSNVVFPDRNKYKISYSDEIQDVICKLLDKDKAARLGSTNDSEEVMAHPFFANYNVDELLERKVPPPFKPVIEDKFGEEGFGKFFNTEGGNAIADTNIPKANRQQVKDHADAFTAFDSKPKKKVAS